MRILVVDDDTLSAEMTAAILAGQQYIPVMAHDAMEAITQLEAHPDIALIVSDLYMPLIDGIELCATLREQGVMLPFVLLTGDTPTAALTATPGLTACLQKEADLAHTLVRTVDRALRE
ncbi:response regulator [Vreelandella malpeensis]|uniref:Response regulator n=1 Tax=Vreelandella malpeensis TaxID=1172368 RepID=A0ABS8DPM2_9GAMM|nr:response regulator [Halomonas malpeensis]MCB8888257.1 response regulator [Halomonas malpeensis]